LLITPHVIADREDVIARNYSGEAIFHSEFRTQNGCIITFYPSPNTHGAGLVNRK